jgi:hypothetical protein
MLAAYLGQFHAADELKNFPRFQQPEDAEVGIGLCRAPHPKC